MRRHHLSADDIAFRERFEACQCPPGSFGHREHVRLAYVYLVDHEVEAATARMRDALLAFLRFHGVDPAKYHETMTRAWMLAVRHFMEKTPRSASSEELIASNPQLLDSKIMLTHYSVDLLFSAEARARFAEPDLDPIPRYTR